MKVKNIYSVGLCLTLTCVLNFAALAQNSKQNSGADSVVGTWILVSETAHKDGKMAYPLGDKPLGSIMLDSGGHFILLIARPDLPKFAAGTRDGGTSEENKAVLAGLLAFCGTFTVDESRKALVLLPVASTFPNWVGAEQNRYLSFRNGEMVWTNRTPAIGAEFVEVVWRRAQ